MVSQVLQKPLSCTREHVTVPAYAEVNNIIMIGPRAKLGKREAGDDATPQEVSTLLVEPAAERDGRAQYAAAEPREVSMMKPHAERDDDTYRVRTAAVPTPTHATTGAAIRFSGCEDNC